MISFTDERPHRVRINQTKRLAKLARRLKARLLRRQKKDLRRKG